MKEGKVERGMELLQPQGLLKLGQVASGFATQSLWFGNRKVGSFGKEQLEKSGEEEEVATKQKNL